MRLVQSIVGKLISLTQASERGSILILAALSALIIFGSAGLAVDVARLYAARAELTRSVDAAALAGVLDFDGTAAGLTAAQTKAYEYLKLNEPTITSTCPTAASCITPDGSHNSLTINASKNIRLYFLPIFGVNNATVTKKAVAGFQNQTLDAVMVVDSTYSMNGAPLTNAKTAATNFTNALLGNNPSGNVVVGLAPLRGCFRPSPITYSDCVYNTVQSGTTYVQPLTSNKTAIDSAISSITAGGMSATNICTGLGKGYEVLTSSTYGGNHIGQPNNRQYMVLLSDGDNVYFGQTVYQASPASPNTFSINSTNYACQPPNTCTSWGTPCHNGTYTSGAITISSDGFDTNNWTGGTGWAGAWTATSGATTTNSGTPQAGSYHARLANSGSITRVINLSGYTNVNLTYYAKQAGSWNSGDTGVVQASADGVSWTTLRTHSYTLGTSYQQFTSSLNAFAGDSSVYIRFRANTGSSFQYFYVDTVNVSDPNTTSDGYLNGQDGQDYTSCSETPVPRERQLDVETLNIANAIKARGVEIYVVSFSACANSDGTTVYNNSGNVACTSQPNPVSSPPSSGKVGDLTSELTANFRLAKCIASSKAGTNDHWFYATDVSQLPNIFTTIAAQIAHRLVE